MESSAKMPPQAETGAGTREALDKATLESIKDIFHLLASAVSSLKLFPSHHTTVIKFIDDLYARLRAYFENRQELELDVQENAFMVDGTVVYKEEHLSKSLPYLFHKDGMQRFAILKEIDKVELRDFLEVIRKSALLPLDESDVVMAIWEKDLADIRIFAPDEHLLSKIDIFTRQSFDVFIDRGKLFSGQIDLSPDDLKDVKDKTLSLGLMEQEEKKDYAEQVTTLDDKDKDLIESMVGSSRQTPPEKEFHDMIFELLYLEERTDQIVSILGFLERHHRELLMESKFTHAVQFLKLTHELRNLFASRNPEKASEFERFLKAIPDGRNIDLIKEAIGRKDFDSLAALFEYLKFLGTASVPLASELLDETQELGTRRAAFAYLEEMSQENIEMLANQLQDSKPAASKDIIALLGRHPSRKVLTYLAPLSTYANKEIKIAAVETLASFAEPLAQKIIFTFLQDEDEDVCAAAAARLHWPGDKSIFERAGQMISTRQFHDRSTKAKIAVMNFLAGTKTPEALAALRKAMEKSGLFARANREHTRLCAVEALAFMATPEAWDALRHGLKSPNKRVAEACRRALERAPGKAAP